jgi:VIT1/CCC1 family predicted Fe2+/Mn2+ transporter
VYLWIAAIPCFIILVYVWKVSNAIQRDEVFTEKTAERIKTAAVILMADAAYFFAGGVVLLLLGLNRPGVLFLTTLVCVFGISLALLAAVLARYISKAALLQEEADGTI